MVRNGFDPILRAFQVFLNMHLFLTICEYIMKIVSYTFFDRDWVMYWKEMKCLYEAYCPETKLNMNMALSCPRICQYTSYLSDNHSTC